MPKLKKGDSLIKVRLAGVCNTDKEILRGYRPDFKGVLGHEFVGEVIESDDLELVGKLVVGELNEGCQACEYCNKGLEKHCESRRVLGIHGKDGCFSEYINIRTDLLHIIPDTLDINTAIFVEPLAAACEIAEQVHFSPDSKVAIIGDGRLSYMIAGVIALYGVDLSIIGRHDDKLREFEKFGKIMKNTSRKYDIVIDATGHSSGLEAAAGIVKNKGTIIVKSTYAGNTSINMSYFVVNEITIKGSRCGPFEPAIRLLNKGLISLPEIELYSLEDFERAFSSKAFKVGFKIS